MGYQNNERPTELDTLIVDVACDLDDLQRDILAHDLSDGGEILKVLKSIEFIRESVRQIRIRSVSGR